MSRRLMYEKKEYLAIAALNKSTQTNSQELEGRLEGALKELCSKFDPIAYARVVNAYRLLGNEYQVQIFFPSKLGKM